jgi:hypothetical protein
MRTFWLAVIGVVLLSGTGLYAQESRLRQLFTRPRIDSDWAINQPSETVVAPAAPGTPLPPTAPGNHSPAAPVLDAGPAHPIPPADAPPVAHPPAPAGPGGCAGCGRVEISDHCLNRCKQWLCYRPIRGGCKKPGHCLCNCFIPIYAYWLGETFEGNCHTLPACVNDKPCCAHRCGPTGHSLFGAITDSHGPELPPAH